jgi:WD40 repeat protein
VPEPIPSAALHEALAEHFSLDELKLLCHDAGIDPESVPYAERGKGVFAFCIVGAFHLSQQLPALLRECIRARPGVNWADLRIETAIPSEWHSLFTPQSLVSTQGGAAFIGTFSVSGDVVGRDKITITEETAYSVFGLRNPYLGLDPFTYRDRDKYAGREPEVFQAVSQLTAVGNQRTLLFVTGTSGCGKSSFAMAGLLPALQDHYLSHGYSVTPPTVMKPSLQPIAQLAEALRQMGLPPEDAFEAIKPFMIGVPSSPPSQHQIGLLVIDQFEELYTQSDPIQRDMFLSILAKLPPFAQLRMHVISTLRADYLPALFNSKHLYDIAKQGMDLRAMTEEELAIAIQRPLQVAYPTKRFEPPLVSRLVEDAAGDAASLPLLQVTLEDLFERGQLRLSQYDSLSDAIRKRADQVITYVDHDRGRLQTRTAEERDAIMQVLLDLIDVAQSNDDMRYFVSQRRTLATMVEKAPERERLIRELTRARLLSMESEPGAKGQPPIETVTLIHESLIYNWDALRETVARKRQLLQQRIRFKEALQAWQASPSDDYLLTGVRLAEARELERANDVDVRGDAERDFVRRSIERAESEQRAREQTLRQIAEQHRLRAEAQAGSARRLRALMVAIVVVALTTMLAGGAGLVALHQAQTAAASRSRQLAGVAERQRLVDSNRALLIGLEAYRASPTREALDFLHYAVMTPEQHVLTLDRGSDRTTGEDRVSIAQVRFSPDGTKLLAFDERMDVWDVVTGRHLRTFGADVGPIHDAQFSNDGTRIFSGSEALNVWSVETGAALSTTFATRNVPSGIRISPDDRHVVTFDSAPEAPEEEWTEDTFTAQLWDAATGTWQQDLVGHTTPIDDAAFSKADGWIAAAGRNGLVLVWRIGRPSQPHSLRVHAGPVQRVSFSTDSSMLAAAGADGKVVVWNVGSWTEIHRFQFDAKVNDVTFSPDSQRLAAGSDDGNAIVWDMQTGAKLGTSIARAAVTGVVVSPNGSYVLAAVSDGIARMFHTATGKLTTMFGGHEGGVVQASFSPDNQKIVTLDAAGQIRIWSLSVPGVFSGHTLRVWSAVLSPDERRLVTASEDWTARVWDVATQSTLFTLAGHGDQVQYAEFSPDAQLIVTASHDGTARIWDAHTGRPLPTALTHPGAVHTARFSPDGQYVLTSCSDGIARLWDLQTGTEARKFEGHSGAIHDARFSHSQGRIVTTGDDGTVMLWDLATGVVQGRSASVGSKIFSATFSPDDQHILYGGYDRTARLWNINTERVVRAFSGHDDSIAHVDFSPDGRKIVTASLDETVRIWDTVSGELLNILRGNDDVVNYAAFSRDEMTIVTSGSNTTARIYPLRTERVLDLARQRTIGELECWERVRFLGELIDCPIATIEPSSGT